MKIYRIILCLLSLALALSPLACCAENGLQKQIIDLLEHVRGDMDYQAWLDGPVTDAAGGNSDNYIIILNHIKHSFDFDVFASKAAEQVQGDTIKNPVTRQRCALSLIAAGRPELVPTALVDDTVGKLGVMSYVFGLHLLNNGAPSELWTVDQIVETLISVQKQDGGWAVMGNFGDVDVTAMCLQALACVPESDQLSPVIESAVGFLSGKQLENGGFSGYGTENEESSAQVIVALSSLGIDPANDERFIKNGKSVLDALMAYQLPSGGFGHLPGDTEENGTANIQTLQALVALNQMGTAYFDLDAGAEIELPSARGPLFSGWKMWAMIGIGVLAVAGSIYALTRKRGRMKQLLFVLLLCAIAAAAVCMIEVESTASYYGSSVDGPADGEVYLTIRCDTVAGISGNESTPENGVILERTAMPFQKGDSVFDILTAAARKYEIQMEHQGGTGDMAYVCGINYLYEYEYDDLSGWIFSVNGETPSIGCGAYKLEPGDEISWEYTLKLGEDLK